MYRALYAAQTDVCSAIRNLGIVAELFIQALAYVNCSKAKMKKCKKMRLEQPALPLIQAKHAASMSQFVKQVWNEAPYLEWSTRTGGGALLPGRRNFLGKTWMKRVRLMECLLKKGMMPRPRLCSTCTAQTKA